MWGRGVGGQTWLQGDSWSECLAGVGSSPPWGLGGSTTLAGKGHCVLGEAGRWAQAPGNCLMVGLSMGAGGGRVLGSLLSWHGGSPGGGGGVPGPPGHCVAPLQPDGAGGRVAPVLWLPCSGVPLSPLPSTGEPGHLPSPPGPPLASPAPQSPPQCPPHSRGAKACPSRGARGQSPPS